MDDSCLVEARARIFSAGGVVLLAVCGAVTAIFFISLTRVDVTGVQQLIGAIFFFAVWGYFASSVTERLHLTGNVLTFRSLLGRTREIPLTELEEMILRHNGYSLDRGFSSIEIRRRGKKTDRIALGPCWNHAALNLFLESTQEAINQTDTYAEKTSGHPVGKTF